MSKYSLITICRHFLALTVILCLTRSASSAGVGPCTAERGGRYFIDSLFIPHYNATLYIGYDNDEASQAGGLLMFSTQDSCLLIPGVISCDQCVGRSSSGSTYRGAVLRHKTLLIRQHTIDYDIDIYIALAERMPSYKQIVVRSLSNSVRRICIPRRTLYLTELGFMQLDLSEDTLSRYFKIKKRS